MNLKIIREVSKEELETGKLRFTKWLKDEKPVSKDADQKNKEDVNVKKTKDEKNETKDGVSEQVAATLAEKYGSEKAAEIIKIISAVGDEDDDKNAKKETDDEDEDEGKDKDEKNKSDEKKKALDNKKSFDAEVKKAVDEAVERVRDEFKEKEQAKDEVSEVAGKTGTQDSANAYYLIGLQALGIQTDGIAASEYKSMFRGAKAASNLASKNKPALVMDASKAAQATKEIDDMLAKIPNRQ